MKRFGKVWLVLSEPWGVEERLDRQQPLEASLLISEDGSGRLEFNDAVRLDGRQIDWLECSARYQGEHLSGATVTVNCSHGDDKFVGAIYSVPGLIRI